MKVDVLMICVHYHKKALVDVALSPRREELARRPAQNISKRKCNRVFPIFVGCLVTRRGDPGNVFDPGLGEHLATQEARARAYAMSPAEMDQIADETAKILVFRSDVFPIGPRDLIVLAISVVVPALCSSDLVAREQHRNAERQQQCGEQIALLAIA